MQCSQQPPPHVRNVRELCYGESGLHSFTLTPLFLSLQLSSSVKKPGEHPSWKLPANTFLRPSQGREAQEGRGLRRDGREDADLIALASSCFPRWWHGPVLNMHASGVGTHFPKDWHFTRTLNLLFCLQVCRAKNQTSSSHPLPQSGMKVSLAQERWADILNWLCSCIHSIKCRLRSPAQWATVT